MKKLFLIILLAPLLAQAQSPAYFQQEVNYFINVTLDDKNHMLNGNERFIYTNNSPNALHEIYMHLWPNAYKNRTTALAKQLARMRNYVLFYTLHENKGFIDSLDFKVNGQAVKWEFDPVNIDIAKITLNKPLQPGQSIEITTPFRVKIPSGSISRLGHIGESYQITQWYPKPAVYDAQGWHQMPYLTQGEFYSEFGSFDVSITLPSNYVIGATGDCQTESEVKFMRELAGKGTERPDLHADNAFPESSKEMKTVRFTQKNVHDFGWFADKRWMVLQSEVKLPHSGNTVTTWALFTPESKDLWTEAPTYLNDATYYYSLWNGDYPYSQVTAVDGTISAGGGMEYPNVTVIGSTGNARNLEVVIMHEVGHNWFYGILGSNERDNAWMDEGINSFNEDRYMDTKYPDGSMAEAMGLPANLQKGSLAAPQRTLSELSYLFNARQSKDQPLQCHSDVFTSMNYGGMVYKKTAIVFQYLYAFLGQKKFDECMQAYFEKWKFKHPQPEDIREVFESTTGLDLSWFFEDLIQTTKKIDFAICSVKNENGKYVVRVKNVGETRGPVSVSQLQDGKVVSTTWVNPLNPGESTTIELTASSASIDHIQLDGENYIPEIDRKNNTAASSGLMKRVEPLKFSPVTGLENPERTQVFFTPLVGWNKHDGTMVGLQLHNRMIPQRNFEWSIAPMFALDSKNITGFGRVDWNKKAWNMGARAQRFGADTNSGISLPFEIVKANYTIIEPYIKYNLFQNPLKLNNGASGYVRLAYQYSNQYRELHSETIDLIYYDRSFEEENFQFDAVVNKRYINGWNVEAKASFTGFIELLTQNSSGGTGSGFQKAFLEAETTIGYTYNKRKKKDIEIRLFFGDNLGSTNYVVFGADGVSGSNDYNYRNLYLARYATSGLLDNQVSAGQGQLFAATGGSTSQLFAVNFNMQLPVKFPIGIYGGFANMGGYYNLAAAGISFPIVKDVFEVYVPVWGDSNTMNSWDARSLNFGERVMFNLNLNLVNPFQIIKNIQ